ncbi:uncharacterized protein LOC142817442 [Rhipicephalus microplus]|uniref:uncharacterized protein LOC142817442 n=1 Tax=Rhipicephalus microplus TaxID=6941 RepID=UPI002F2AFAE5
MRRAILCAFLSSGRGMADLHEGNSHARMPENVIRQSVCSSKKTAAPVKYGITAAQLEYADSSGHCKNGTFPLLRALKQIVKFFKDNYTSEANFENCVALRT